MELMPNIDLHHPATVEEAIAAAQSELGVDASMTVLQRPPHLIPTVV